MNSQHLWRGDLLYLMHSDRLLTATDTTTRSQEIGIGLGTDLYASRNALGASLGFGKAGLSAVGPAMLVWRTAAGHA